MEGNSLERYIEIYNSYFIAEKLKEEKKMKKCPLFDTSCPYCLASGECSLTHPEDECDDYYFYNGEEEEEE